jgi:hypothetical protein
VKTDSDNTGTSMAVSPCAQQYASPNVPSCQNSVRKSDRHGVRKLTSRWRIRSMEMNLFGSLLPTLLGLSWARSDTDFGAAGSVSGRQVGDVPVSSRDPAIQKSRATGCRTIPSSAEFENNKLDSTHNGSFSLLSILFCDPLLRNCFPDVLRRP